MKHRLIIICFILLLSIKSFALSNYAVLMEESPAGAGEIKPGAGVHTFNVNETVTLTTIARPGWRFVYWLGDVSDPTANQTMLAVDGPKIVIAVFARDKYELPGGDMGVGSGTERLIRRNDSFSSGGFSGGAYNPPSSPYYPPVNPPETPPDKPPPVPEVPEPATVLLLGIGAWFMTINRKK